MAASSSAGRRWCNREKGVTGGVVRRRCTNISLSVGSRCQLYSFLAPRKQYKLVEMKLLAQQRDLQAKVPDIEKCLTL